MKRVVVHIDALALKGFRHEDRHAIAGALREELGRQLAQLDPARSRSLMSRREVARLGIGAVRIPCAETPTGVGAQTARAIARGLGS